MVVWFVMAQLTVSAVLKLIKSEKLIITTFSVEVFLLFMNGHFLKKFLPLVSLPHDSTIRNSHGRSKGLD